MQASKVFPLVLVTVSLVLFLSNSNGVAHQQNKDRTGAPGSDPTCQQCHAGGSFAPEINAFLVLDGDIALGSSYQPGQTHTLVVSVNATSGTPAGYGVHGTAVLADGANAGSFNDQDANDCIWLDEVDGRHIFEQNDLCASGTFEVEWVAPAAGSGPVTFYVASVTANGNGVSSGDAFAGGSFAFDEGVVGVESLQEDDRLLVSAAEAGALQLTCGTPHHVLVLSMEGRVLYDGHVAGGVHTVQVNHSGLAVVRASTAQGRVDTHKIWFP